MTAFSAIEQSARERLGGGDALESRLIRPEPPESLAMIGDDRYLSVMCRRIFRAGLTHRLVDARWPAFEIAFDDFDPAAVAALDDDDLKRLATDEALIRHRRKIFAVRNNAVAMQAIRPPPAAPSRAGSCIAWQARPLPLCAWPPSHSASRATRSAPGRNIR